jgi:hypothetical protein
MAATLTSTGLTFSDSTTQSTAAVPLTGGQLTGNLVLKHLVSRTVPVYQWSHKWTHPNASNSYVDLLYNTGSYSDIHFMMVLHSRTGSNGFYMWSGIFGGYGGQYSQKVQVSNSGFSLTWTNISAGYGKISIVNNYDLSSSNQGMEAMALLYTTEGCGVYNGTLYS